MAIRTREKAASLLIMSLFALSVSAQVAVVGTTTVIDNGAGAQSDPHVSGDWVSYTNNADGANNQIGYYNFLTGSKSVVPTSGGKDFVVSSDVSGSRIVFTRGTTTAIYLFDTSSGNVSELAPSTNAKRRNPSIGGGTVAWQDFGVSPSALWVYDVASGTAQKLTADVALDSKNPAVSPDGLVVAWEKCAGTVCNIYQAKQVAGQWSSETVTGADGGSSPDTTGQIVVYAAKRTGDTTDHIYWKSVAGGLESKIAVAGTSPTQRNPRASGPLIAFESSDGGPWDVYVFDTSTNTLYRITDTPAVNETLSDITVSSTGQVRVVYASDAAGDSNVYAFTFQHAVNPSQRLSDLIAKVADAGLLRSVKAKLENALTKLDNGHLGPSCNLLSAASNEIRALSGKKIEASYGTELNDSLNRIRDAAGCR